MLLSWKTGWTNFIEARTEKASRKRKIKRVAVSQLVRTAAASQARNSEVLEQRDLLSAVPFISEVHPSGSSNGTYAADWFEITNTGTTDLDITGWKMDDSSKAIGNAVALRGVTTIPAGKSAVFFEGNSTGTTDASVTEKFSTAWFGSTTLPSGFLIGAYGGSGVGLGTSGDEVHLFNSSGTLVTGVTFGSATASATFDNTAQGTSVSKLSTAGVNGAFLSSNGAETGSPGTRLNASPLTGVDLSNYVRVGRFDLPEPTRTTPPANSVLAQEVSAVTYNKDTDTLFVVGDGGTSIVQVSKTGALIDSMTLATGSSPQGTEFYDPEGLTYIGKGQFVMVEERDRVVSFFTYVPNTTLNRADVKTVALGTNVGNIGIEGISYDPTKSGYIAVKETTPEGIFQTNIDFDAGTATNGSASTENSMDLFDPALAGVVDLADVFALSNLTTLTGGQANNLLLLSQESGKIVNIDRSGNISSSLSFVVDAGNPLSVPEHQHEGLTMDGNGNLYVVSENGGGDFDHPQLWVFAPATAPNQAPTGLTLTNTTTSLDENTNTTARRKVASIVLADDGIGTNNITVSGTDKNFFEVIADGLYLKAGTVLDFETKSKYDIVVEVDDPAVGNTPDATASYSLTLNDVVNEDPAHPTLFISEIAPWSSGNSPIHVDWFEVSNTGSTAVDITGWKIDDSSNSFVLGGSLGGITSIAPGESVIFLETSDLAGKTTEFLTNWFGANAPAGLQIGNYTGSGLGLSAEGDAVNLFDSTGVRQASVTFGASPTGTFSTFNNAAGLNASAITTLSAVGENGAFIAANSATEIGSPGSIGELFISEVAPGPVAVLWVRTGSKSPTARRTQSTSPAGRWTTTRVRSSVAFS